MKLHFSFWVVGAALLASCVPSGVISKFKNSQTFNFEKCVGVAGKVEYEAFQLAEEKRTPIWVINVKLSTQEGQNGRIQYRFNETTLQSEISYAEIEGDNKLSPLLLALKINGFCKFRV